MFFNFLLELYKIDLKQHWIINNQSNKRDLRKTIELQIVHTNINDANRKM